MKILDKHGRGARRGKSGATQNFMPTITKTKFAKQLGVSDAYIYKVQDQLSMVKVKGKKKHQIDLLGSKTLEFLKKREGETPIEFEEAEPETKPVKQTQGRGNNPSGLPGGDKTKSELEYEKIRLGNENIQMLMDQKRGNLIDKKLVISTHNALASIDENQLKSLNVIICPKIDSVYTRGYSDAVKKILELTGQEKDHDLKTDILKILNASSEKNKKEITEITEDAIGKILQNIKREFDLFLQRADEVE